MRKLWKKIESVLDRLPTIKGVSPKVYVPFVFILAATTIHGIRSGEVDATELWGYAAGLFQFITGITVPPAPQVRQEEVNEIAKARQQHKRLPSLKRR